jgi:hypothetical protein
MPHPIAIAFLHGIGRTEPGYSASMQRALERRFVRRIAGACAVPESMLVFEEINWSAALQRREDRLWRRLKSGGGMRYPRLRRFMVDFAADAIAYQPAPSDRSAYDAVHRTVAEGLARLAGRAGARAPLCLVSHSLGTVIANNYIYDLTKRRRSFMCGSVRAAIGKTPLERGETLSLFYTMGSPIALWGIRYPRFGDPIRFPPRGLARHHPGVEAEWINLYDPDDVIAYPLRSLCARYRSAVTEDRRVDVGSIFARWTPLSHMAYWGNGAIADLVADGLARVWRQSSALALVPRERSGEPARRTSAPRAS